VRRAFLVIALLVSACEKTIVLGSECPSHNGACAKEHVPTEDGSDASDPGHEDGNDAGDAPTGTLDAGASGVGGGDAGGRDAGRLDRDAGVLPMRDARVPEDAGPALFPPFANPSFELSDGGKEGEIPVNPQGGATSTETPIAPWYECRNGTSVNSSVTTGLPGPNQVTIQPTDGKTFLTDTFPIVALNVNGITQDLTEPLRAGQRYAFAVDLWAERDAVQISDLVLELAAADPLTGCLLGRTIASSPPIVPGGWRTLCMSFVTPTNNTLFSMGIRSLMFMVNAPGDYTNLTRLHIDNIRSTPQCND
jgi:hypothetical protein